MLLNIIATYTTKSSIFSQMKLLIITILTSFTTAFAQGLHTIRGQVIGQKTGTVYLYSAGVFRQAAQLVDSVELSSQFFSFRKVLSEPIGYFISMNSAPGQLYLVWDEDVVISLKTDDLNQSSVEESPVSEALKSFSDTVEAVYDKRFKVIYEQLHQSKQGEDTLQAQQLYQQYLTLGIEYRDAIASYIKLRKGYWDSLFVLTS